MTTKPRPPSATTGSTPPTDLPGLRIYKPEIVDYKLKALFYGPPGVGKTSLLATANLHPSTAPILIINVEGGMLSVTDTTALGMTEAPDVVDLTSYDQLGDIFWFLAKGDHPYRSVGIDSLAELRTLNLDSVVGRSIAKSGGKRTSPDEVFLDDYGTSNTQLKRALRMFRDLPMHVFYTCHDSASQDKEKNEVVWPDLPPGLKNAVIGYMDVVGYMYAQNTSEEDGTESVQRRMLCQPYSKWWAKDRSPGSRLGLCVDEPSIPKLIDLITNRKESDPNAATRN